MSDTVATFEPEPCDERFRKEHPMTTPAIRGVHHSAFRCRDAEETRRFYEDVLGLPLKAALAFEKDPGGNDRPYMHLFFELGDGNFIAFFDLPHTVEEKKFGVKDGMEDYHVAMELGSWEDLLGFKKRLEEKNIPVFGPINHHFCHSIYFFDPNGINLEFTVRDAKHDAILAEEAAGGPRIMREWAARTAAVRVERLRGSDEQRTRSEAFKRMIADSANSAIAKAKRKSA
jgi:catechol 2,3-dioxygenase-like lactoylglutathione lyase family enzyme